MLLLGRCIATLLAAAAQVPLVRYLSKSDYGAFAYVLSLVTILQPLATLGLNRAVSRFVPIYHERGEYGKLLGTIVLLLLTVVTVLLVLPVLVYRSDILARFVHEPKPLALMPVLLFLLPAESLNDIAVSLFASFGGSREIFFRVYILGPVLRLIVILLLIAAGSTVWHLAVGYLVASIIGVASFCFMLVHRLRQLNILSRAHLDNLNIPAAEIFAFALPLLMSEAMTGIVMNAAALLLLGYYCDMTEVAAYRAAAPLARLNMMVMATFSVLYTPVAARLFARRDFAGVNHLYWQTAVWIAVLTFPFFLATFSISRPLVELLYGSRYTSSGTVLMLLSAGYYVNVGLGFNALTLRVFGKLRAIFAVNFAAAVIGVAISIVLITRHGAIGAAIGTAAAMILVNLLTQFCLYLAPGMNAFDLTHAKICGLLLATAVALLVITTSMRSNIYVALPLAFLTSASALLIARRYLDVVEIFPEVARLPLVRRVFRHAERAVV